MRLQLLVLTLALSATNNPVRACMMSWQSQDDLKAQAAIVVEAVVRAKRVVGHNFRGDEYRYDIRVDAVFKGEMSEGPTVVTYEDLKVHRRGDQTVCPLKHGSGIEHDLVIGRRYQLFLRSADDPEVLLAKGGYWPPMRLMGRSGMVVADVFTTDGASASGIDGLLGALESDDAGIRESAAGWLGAIGRPAQRAIPALRQLSERDIDQRVRNAANKAIGEIEKR